MTKEQLDTIARVRLTLNSVTVRGKENLDAMLGCILTLEKLERDVLAEMVEQRKKAAEGDGHE